MKNICRDYLWRKKKVEVINSFTDDQIEKLKNLFGEEKTIEQIYDDFFETIDIYNNIKNQLQG